MSKASIKYVSLFILVLLGPGSNLSATAVQDSKINPYMLFTYLKDTDSRQILQVKMTNITQVGEVPLPGLNIGFYNNEALLGEAITDTEGNASCTIGSSLPLFASEDGSWPFSAIFEGDSLTEETYSELSIYDVDIQMMLSEEEGERFVTLHATTLTSDGRVPVTGEEIGVYVPRMFSLLPVSIGMLDENGAFRIKFPDDMPGDSLGNLTVIGRFNDHYLFGNVERREEVRWGTEAEITAPVYRSLWSTLAPKWMIISLTIMLLGVWGHYTYVIINLFRIRKEGLKKKE
ncbi:MAG: hypothetical protein P1P83_05025 [Bacteroidales bacterium]|nr:hypothetical protein [Bacteroidales bacterium]MDT8374507.1 hypothetical protein [Bacteroidales bacterium]